MKNKKVIVLVSTLLLVGGLTFSKMLIKDNKSKLSTEAKQKENVNTLAVYIRQEDGSYKESTDIPQSGYVLDSNKSTCSNGVIPKWDTENNRFYTDNLTKSGTSCYLYFDSLTKKVQTALGELTVTKGEEGFTNISPSDEYPSGIYYDTDDDDGETYYYRGSVDNNWVQFGGFYWRIIRINGDGSIRMIYSGVANGNVSDANRTGTTTQISNDGSTTEYAFNTSYDDNAYVGYMYGSTGQSNYANTHTNTNDSTIKGVLDSWYETNIANKGYSRKVDTNVGFCGDRTPVTGAFTSSSYGTLGYGINPTTYAPLGRLYANDAWKTTQTPTLECKSANDLYTVSGASKGNKALTYPVGLITSDEVVYAGGFGGTNNTSYYLYTGQAYWTMSPRNFSGGAVVFRVDSDGDLGAPSVDSTGGVRPVINLRADTEFIGNGTSTNPYIVEGAE